MSNNGKGNAFPLFAPPCETGGYLLEYGLTKRELFAMAAMQGLLANPVFEFAGNGAWAEILASDSLIAADALLAALEEK